MPAWRHIHDQSESSVVIRAGLDRAEMQALTHGAGGFDPINELLRQGA